MWSGPRNISTALMRSWENRADTAVIDEPFYGFYLRRTGKNHPGAETIVAQTETDLERIIEIIAGPIPQGRRILYQKHMTHHLLPEVDRAWLSRVTNCFLIRPPDEVIASYINKSGFEPLIEDLGFVQQLDIFNDVRRRTGKIPPVIDASDVLRDPERTLRLLCDAVVVDFDQAMLSWPPGPRETDGIWAKYWYHEVERSTGFEPYRERSHKVPGNLAPLSVRCRQCYDELYQHRLQ